VPTAGDTERTTELHALAEQFGLTGWDAPRRTARPLLPTPRVRTRHHRLTVSVRCVPAVGVGCDRPLAGGRPADRWASGESITTCGRT
jgi:hypothetical protein